MTTSKFRASKGDSFTGILSYPTRAKPWQVTGWAKVTQVCPFFDVEPLYCPADIGDRCGPIVVNPPEVIAWRLRNAAKQVSLTGAIKKYLPLVHPPGNPLNSVVLKEWITRDAMEEPPMDSPPPVPVANLGAAMTKLEKQLLSGTAPIAFAEVFAMAMKAAGCPNTGGCSAEQYRTGLFAGHELLKNVAYLIRKTGNCWPERQGGNWLGHPPTANFGEEFCTVMNDGKNYNMPTEEFQRRMRMVPNAQKIAKRFIQPRPDCFNDGNVVGTYYHLFALGIVDMLSVGTLSHTSAVAEAIAQSLTSELKLDWVYFELNL